MVLKINEKYEEAASILRLKKKDLSSWFSDNAEIIIQKQYEDKNGLIQYHEAKKKASDNHSQFHWKSNNE